MKRSTIKIALALGLLPACCFEEAGESFPSTESSSEGGSQSSTSVATVTTSTTMSATSEASSDASSSEGTETVGDSATSEETSSTGEEISDWALAFDGTSYARKVEAGGPWPSSDFTVETWVEIQDPEATGIIFDTADVGFQNGWVLYLHNDWHALVFSFFDATHYNNVVTGPTVAEIGTGWHHLAATKSGGTVRIYVDGVTKVTQSVPPSLSFDDSALWSIGGSPDDNADFRLRDVVVDDVRLSSTARYTDDFDPPSSYDPDDANVILTLELDEGSGGTAMSSDGSASFSIDNPTWVPGNSG